MKNFREFIETKNRKIKGLRISLWLSIFITSLFNLKIAGLFLFFEGLGSIWRYRWQSLEEHLARFGRALLGLIIFATLPISYLFL